MKTKLLLPAIILLGFLLRIHTLSPFKVYPDSYQNLLVAYNLAAYHNVAGYLGNAGMFYPDFFMWSRPVYALLINAVSNITGDTTTSAAAIALFLGILAIPLAYVFIKKVFHQTSLALAGAALTALSFNHTVWGGFIMTETSGVFFMLLFLLSLFSNLNQKPSLLRDSLTGALFGIAVLTRYEYLIVFLPVIFLIFQQNPKPYLYLFYLSYAFLAVLAFAGIQIYPVSSIVIVVFEQLTDLLKITGLVTLCFGFLLVFKFFPKVKTRFEFLTHRKFLLVVTWTLALLLCLFYPAFYQFFRHDLLLTLSFLIGVPLLLQDKKYRAIGVFVLLTIFSLGIIYHRINPEMERYITHMLPFLLIPAAFSLGKILNLKSQRMVQAAFLILFILQSYISYMGLRSEEASSWYRISYEEKAATMLKNSNLLTNNSLLLVSLPEPYFYITRVSTQSITYAYPHIYFSAPDNQPIIIVQDMGMYTEFPTFAKFIDDNLKPYKIKEFWVHENYHNKDLTLVEKHPVSIYKISYQELKQQIEKSQTF